jgi:RNA polymerase sigma factor (sigma-70 family)
VDDRSLVAALVSGDPRGLEGAYRAYADRLYTYCRGMLRDPDAAADAVHDTFILAGQRAGQLRDPERLRSWLYAIARNECLRILRHRGRQVPLEEAGEVSAPPVDPATGMHASELAELVWAAAAGLNAGDREVFELAVRHELPAPEVSAMLGVSIAHAHARLSRARAQLERALGALLVARTGRQECPELAELLAGWDGTLTALMRKRISRHIESCDSCAERRRRQLSPAALFSAYAGLPMLVAPAEIWPRLQLTSADARYAEGLDRRAGRWDHATGFPEPWELQRRRTAVAGVAAVAVAAMFAFAGGFLIPPPELAALAPDPPPSLPVVVSPSGTPSAQPSPSTAATPSASPTPPLLTAGPRPPLTVEATMRVNCARGTAAVRAVASQPLASAELHLTIGSVQRSYEMQVDGTTASLDLERLVVFNLPTTWQVAVTAVDGAQAATDPAELPCP